MTPEELGEITAKQEEAERQFKHRLHVCTAAGCLSSGSDKVKAALEKEVKDRGLEHQCKVKGVGCMGLCANGPLVADKPSNVMYQNVTEDDAADIVKSLDTEPVARLECPTEMPFFRRQVKIVLENCGRVDPEQIEDYIAASGYEGLVKALTEYSPSEVVEQVLRSGLRGRGGAGYPTGLKWGMVAKTDAERSTWCATPTKAILALSWTAAYSKATPTACSKAWP
jgi:bidirectional [NiFe] hydrogenase diaphorase subunit